MFTLLVGQYIFFSVRQRDVAGNSSGFGLVLWAETKEGIIYSAEATSEPASGASIDAARAPTIASELGHLAASRLFSQVF